MPPYPPWELMSAVSLARVLLVIAALFGLLPALLFPAFPDRGSAGMVGRAVLMLLPVMAMAHLLAFLRLYEGILVLTLVALALLWQFYLRHAPADREHTLQRAATRALHWIDLLTRPRQARTMHYDEAIVDMPALLSGLRGYLPGGLVLGIILAAAWWMRMHSFFGHAAPAFSDAPVTLKWMKLFGSGELYPDGVYPQGMYAVLSLLKKLTFLNSLLVMEVHGPLVGFGLVAVLTLFVRWTTGSILAAAVAALLYGTLPQFLPYEVERHTGYNSQEFGLLFALPAAWFAHEYLRAGNRWHALSAAAAAGAAVFTHPIAAVITLGYVGAAALAGLLNCPGAWRRLPPLAGWGLGAALLAIAPPLVGLTLLGKGWHSESVSFLDRDLRPLLFVPPWPVMVLAAIGLLAPAFLRGANGRLWLAWGVALTGIGLWAGPYLNPTGPLLTMALRNIEAGAAGLSMAVALAWMLLQRPIERTRFGPWIASALLGVVAVALWVPFRPSAIAAQRVSTDETIIQALRFDRNLIQGDWMLVMDEIGYSIALGRGTHAYPDEFLRSARVTPDHWCWEEDGKKIRGQHHVALFVDKTADTSVPLESWIRVHKEKVPLTRIYTSTALDVWYLQYRPSPLDEFNRLWGLFDPTCD